MVGKRTDGRTEACGGHGPSFLQDAEYERMAGQIRGPAPRAERTTQLQQACLNREYGMVWYYLDSPHTTEETIAATGMGPNS